MGSPRSKSLSITWNSLIVLPPRTIEISYPLWGEKGQEALLSKDQSLVWFLKLRYTQDLELTGYFSIFPFHLLLCFLTELVWMHVYHLPIESWLRGSYDSEGPRAPPLSSCPHLVTSTASSSPRRESQPQVLTAELDVVEKQAQKSYISYSHDQPPLHTNGTVPTSAHWILHRIFWCNEP